MGDNIIVQKPRYEFVDLAKGICIFLVVFTHFSIGYEWKSSISIMLLSFRMPLYFCLSGMFFSRYSGLRDFFRRKSNKLLVPFLSFYVISYVLCLLKSLVQRGQFDYSCILSMFQESIPCNEALWFLMCLFICGLVFYLLVLFSDLFKKSSVLVLSICSIIVGAIGFEGGKHGFLHLPLWIDSALTALPFYTFGFILRKHTDFLQSHNYSRYYILIAIVLFIFVSFVGNYSDIRVNNMTEAHLLNYYACGIVGTMAVMFFSKRLNKLPVLSYCGRYSICILLTHVLVQKLFLYSVIYTISSHWNLPYIVVALLFSVLYMLFSYYILIPFMIKYMPHICAQKDVFAQ